MSELIESLLGLPHFSLTDVSDLAEEYCGDFVRRDDLEACLSTLRKQSGSHPNDAIKAREPIKHEEWCKCECGAQGSESL